VYESVYVYKNCGDNDRNDDDDDDDDDTNGRVALE
jgi:hypothetical protein